MDGTVVLVYRNGDFDIAVWTRKNPRPFWWKKGSFNSTSDRANPPTHWMPLPPPPTTEQSSAVQMDDDLDEPLGPACSMENPECESCQ